MSTRSKEFRESVIHSLLTANIDIGIDQVIDCTKYNTLSRLLQVTYFVLKFCYSLLKRVHHSIKSHNDLLNEAEILWIQSSQGSLANKKRFSQWKTQFDLFVAGDKLWHCRGRLQHTNLPWSTIHPILLDEKHHLTTLRIWKAHEQVMHSGTKATLTELR